MHLMDVRVLFACHNRKYNTENCIRSLIKENPLVNFSFVITDDGSTDGTTEKLEELSLETDIVVLHGNGQLYYSGGMRMAMMYTINHYKEKHFDYCLLINDDVFFTKSCVSMMINQSIEQKKAVIVGTIVDVNGNQSYGAIKYIKGIKYRRMSNDEWNITADTFNGNSVLIPAEAFMAAGAIDSHYIHSLGDFDYGLHLVKLGYKIFPSRDIVGICNRNSKTDTWEDKNLTIKERLEKKESFRGAPAGQWFYYLKKNFGVFQAFKCSVTPYIRIFLRK